MAALTAIFAGDERVICSIIGLMTLLYPRKEVDQQPILARPLEP
jgi:hypothetical protein